jgi:betaine lipid synthase
MMRFVDVPNFFEHIYLVDLSPSLCEIARERFARLKWENVTVVCDDARLFSLDDFATPATEPSRATLITMSYSLSIIVS